MKNVIIIILLNIVTVLTINAQEFLRAFETVSHKKTTFLTLNDGSEIEGEVKKLDRKKGLIEEVKMKIKGEKKVIPLEDIKHAYFPQSGLDMLNKLGDLMSDTQQWGRGLFDEERFKKGYAYFEKAEVIVRKKQRSLLMQLLNPTSCEVIKVYHNPFSMETAKLNVKGFTVAGGDDRSYYISKNGEVAYKFSKKNFKKDFEQFFGDCPEIAEKYAKSKWRSFEEIIFAYNEACKN